MPACSVVRQVQAMTTTLFDALMTQDGFRWQQQADPHYAAESRSEEFFTSYDGGDTELEYLGLLHWLIRCVKPDRVIETGTANGLGTLAIASALHCNGRGEVMTVDVGPCEAARELVSRSPAHERVTFVQDAALAFCAKCVQPFDFGFFDSDVQSRAAEIEMLLARDKLAGFAAVHDTGATRFGAGLNGQLRRDLKQFPGLEFPLGRGLTLIHV